MSKLSTILLLSITLLFPQLSSSQPPSKSEMLSKIEAHVSKELINVAKAYLLTLEKEEFSSGYEQLALIFKDEITQEAYINAVKNLHAMYGKPKGANIMGGLSGIIKTREGKEYTTQAILFDSSLVKEDGSNIGALVKITVLVGKDGKPMGIIKFNYIPKSSIQYKGSYKLPNKDNDS